MHPPFSFRPCRKENGPCTVQKKRTLRRVGLRQRRPPAAGGGRLALPCRSQGRKRAALGEIFGPGRSGIPFAPLFAAAHVPARNSQRQRKEKQRPCVNHPDNLRTIRHGTAVTGIAEENSVPEGQAKSEQALIRRPPCARRATAPERVKRFSLWTVHGPFLFWHDKREMGGASPLDKPPAGADPLPAAVRRPLPPSSGCICPAIPMTVFPRRQTAAPFHRKGRITPHARHHPTTGI